MLATYSLSKMLLARLCASHARSARILASSLHPAPNYATASQPGQSQSVAQKDTLGDSSFTTAPAFSVDLGLSRLGRIVDKMQREVDTLTKAFVGKGFEASSSPSFGLHNLTDLSTSLGQGARPFPRAVSGARRLPADVIEDKTAYLVKADVPGMSIEDISVKLQGDTLVVSGQRTEEKEQLPPQPQEGQQVVIERAYGSFVRRFKLPVNVEPEGITASVKDGVLSVTIPKTEAQNKEIPVTVAHDITMAIRQAQSLGG